MGYPLQLHEIYAILLYCGKSCSSQFSYDQITFKHFKWVYLDHFLQFHERREESETELSCGLKGVRFENIEKEIKSDSITIFLPLLRKESLLIFFIFTILLKIAKKEKMLFHWLICVMIQPSLIRIWLIFQFNCLNKYC
ncbi:hypothetical protein RFI_05512 [Reticulomyxa filosa]|uniref:Uncharacterized protein n=1 Tax=Reticulomyxa filosa TaxID=46433 RepID=X6P0E3_RETFI|nr:hypothetical protein RFI_05512 [Reticulomyxa filosa]|eukprot:ETO31608.1 hypothetical protein RFI_05512 [Reticulomyxa filosa]